MRIRGTIKIKALFVSLFFVFSGYISGQNSSQFVSQNVPTTVGAGENFDVSLVFKNNGSTTWKNKNPKGYFLGSENPRDNFTWGTNRIYLPKEVAPGAEVTISGNVKAPETAGVYDFQWQLLQDGVQWFGAKSNNVSIKVTDKGNGAIFISQSAPSSVKPGENFSVSVTFKNMGGTTWKSSEDYSLGSQNPQDNIIWGEGTGRVALPNNVAPSEEVTFTFNLIAPSEKGFYNFQWQMLQEGVEWFGEKSKNRSISVNDSDVDVVDPNTLNNKIMFGYQGWFGARGDGSKVNAWSHYFANNNKNLPTVDFWPDISECEPDELFNTGLTLPDGSQAKLPSAYSAKTVNRHFKWMADYNLDGVFLQRFVNELSDSRYKDFRDKVLQNVKTGAENYGRVFAVMYDISSGADINRFEKIKQDWVELVDAGIADSPNYLKHNGLPVLSVWGIGFNHHGYEYTPAQAMDLIRFLTDNDNPKYNVTLMGGVPTYWRERSHDSETDIGWRDVYTSLDIISPWSVGRYSSYSGINSFRNNLIEPDIRFINQLNSGGKDIDYLPVIWPGFSWGNLQAFHGNPATYNQIPRDGGNFFWKQAYNVIDQGVSMIYVAMFDEIDEGTAMFKLAPTQNEVPDPGQFTNGRQFVSLDADGENLPSDWYLRLAECTREVMLGEKPLTHEMPECESTSSPVIPVAKQEDRFAIKNFKNYIEVTFLSEGDYSINLINIYGQVISIKKVKVASYAPAKERIELSSLKTGIYVLSVFDNRSRKALKFRL